MASPGRFHRSVTVREVGWEGQLKMWAGVWGAPLHEGQRGSGALPTLSKKLLREEELPERNWERTERWRRGRSFSSSATTGGEVRRTLLGEREAIARATAPVCRDLRVSV